MVINTNGLESKVRSVFNIPVGVNLESLPDYTVFVSTFDGTEFEVLGHTVKFDMNEFMSKAYRKMGG